jgi:hypothetical protein
MTDLNTIFTHFSPQEVEEFYQFYQLWSLQKKRAEIVAQMHELEEQIAENEAMLKAVSPSAIALAALTQFRASGVDDIDLLDSMLERGDEWLDHTLQLFERCERMDMLEGSATQWCRHALEGAYDWIESMDDINETNETNDSEDDTQLSLPAIATDQSFPEVEPLPATTEADFLQKLMSDDEITEDTFELDSKHEEIEYAIPHVSPDIEEESEPTETTILDQTYIIPHVPPDIEEESEPTETPTLDQTKGFQPTEPASIAEQVDPLMQTTSSPEKPANAEQKLASQTSKHLKMYRTKQRKKKKQTKRKIKRDKRS